MLSRKRQLLYLAGTLIGAVFVLVYRGPLWPYVRGYMGDWLIVQFIYLIARFVVGLRWRYWLAGGIWIFAIGVEIFQLVAASSIPHNLATELTVGSTFDPIDIAVYGLGLITVLILERWLIVKAQV